MQHKKPVIEYSDGQFQFKVPFIMCADFESILEQMGHVGPGSLRNPLYGPNSNLRISTTRDINVNIPSGWCIHSKFAYGEVKDPLSSYRGRDCNQTFCDHVIGKAHRLYGSFPEKPMEPLTKAQWKDYKYVSSCHICLKLFREGKLKVRDHCHYSGIYRGAAHSLCNLQYKIPSYILVVFHNLSGYDAHMFIKQLASSSSDGAKMGVIAKNKEDYLTFSISVEVDKYINKDGEECSKEIELRFIDSFKFMSSSLNSLVNNLACGNNKFFGFEDYNQSQYKLLIQKGIYPYEYMDDWDKFRENVLPPNEAFYSKLATAGVNEEDYEHARRVWSKFEMNNLGEYHDLYLRTDVILLANIFEAFRKVCLDNYGLDPAHVYMAPGLAWKACLKKTRIRLELLLDPDMLLMFERGIRGGITQYIHRWAKANNPLYGFRIQTWRTN